MKYAILTIIMTSLLFLTGCVSAENNNRLIIEPQSCPEDEVMVCEGHTKRDMECSCVNKRILERQLININIWS